MLTLNPVRETEAEACLVPLICAILSRCQGQDGNSDRLFKEHYLLLEEGSIDLVRLLAYRELLLPPSVLLPLESLHHCNSYSSRSSFVPVIHPYKRVG